MTDRRIIGARDIFRERSPSHRHGVAVQQSGTEKMLKQYRSATDAMKVDHGVRAARREIAEHRCATKDRLQIAQREVDFCLLRQR